MDFVYRSLARPEGFEPPTTWFEARYSIQLSYGRAAEVNDRISAGIFIGPVFTMSRYRPPQPRSSPYITRSGFAALQAEEESHLGATAGCHRCAVGAAAAEGDRSENAEYIYRKKELREIDRRIRYLQKRLPDLKIVDSVGDAARVFFWCHDHR